MLDYNLNEKGWTPLLFATHNENLKMAKTLMEGGASVLTQMDSGITVFHMAAANNDVRILD